MDPSTKFILAKAGARTGFVKSENGEIDTSRQGIIDKAIRRFDLREVLN